MTRWICVTGMHRSGTSALSRVLNLLGVDLGSEERLIPAAPDNPRGFWENQSIAVFNESILNAFGGAWDNPPHFPRQWQDLPALEKTFDDARMLLHSSFEVPPDVGGWKDPRSSLLLPYWRKVVDVSNTVMALRNPLEVASSLRSRQGHDAETSARLWLRYTLEAIRNDPDHVLVTYDDLLTRTDDVAHRLVEQLGLPAPSDQTMREIEGFVEPTLRRSTDHDDLGGPIMAVARSAYDVIRSTPDRGYQAVMTTLADSLIPWADGPVVG